MKRNDLIYLALSFLIPFNIYCYTLCPTISVYADAGEFPTMAYVNSFGHPPGFPLFILIIKTFFLLPFGNPAMKANLAAAFISAIALSLFFLLAKLLTKNAFVSFVAALILAFSKIYWRNAVISEVFGLLSFFIVLTNLLFLLWTKTKNKKYFYWFLVSAGFGLGHHPLIVVILIPLLIAFVVGKYWRNLNWKDFLLSPFLVLTGFLPYIYIYLAAKETPLMNWENPVNLVSMFRLIFRAGYGTFSLSKVAASIQPLPQLKEVAAMFFSSFTIGGILIFVFGIFSAFKKNKTIFFSSLLVLILISILLPLYSNMPLNNISQIAYLERFQIVPSIFIALLSGFGLLKIKSILSSSLEKSSKEAFVVFSLAIVLVIFGLNFKKVDQRNNYFGQNLAEDLVSNIPDNSIFIFEGDAVTNSLLYNRFVLGKNTKIELVAGNMAADQLDWYLKNLSLFYPDMIFPVKQNNSLGYLNAFIGINSQRKGVYLSLPETEEKNQILFNKNPWGMIYQYETDRNLPLVPEDFEEDLVLSYNKYKNLKELKISLAYPDFDYRLMVGPKLRPIPVYSPIIINTISNKIYPREWPEAALLSLYAQPLVFFARDTHYDIKKAETYYKKSLEISPYLYTSWLELGDDYWQNNMPDFALDAWKKGLLQVNDKKIAAIVESKIKTASEYIIKTESP